MKIFETVLTKVRNLKIQGAEAVAKIAVESMAEKMQQSMAEGKEGFVNEMLIHAQELKDTRPTEPMMRNELSILVNSIKQSKEERLSGLKKLILKEARRILVQSQSSRQKIFERVSNFIPDNSSILIHCHSTTLIGSLVHAFENGKKFQVYCCETRPLYQGVKSAKELAATGIKTTLIVDSAANLAIKTKQIAAVFVGADAIDWHGNLFNKIGTSQIALAAKANNIPFFAIANSLKFDFETKSNDEKIEERSRFELFSKKARFQVWNPAFDKTNSNLITKLITEKGALAPKDFVKRMRKLRK